MAAIEVGVMMDLDRETLAGGLKGFGTEEVNAMIQSGRRVASIEAASAITKELRRKDGMVTLTLVGFSSKVHFEE